jgi:hypothetical protein
MKSITRLSLALIMFSLFSISYLVTSATSETITTPTGTPGVPSTGMTPTGTPGMPSTGMAPTGTPESGGIASWIKGGLKALGIGSAPKIGDTSHCAEFSGPPKAACEAAAAKN